MATRSERRSGARAAAAVAVKSGEDIDLALEAEALRRDLDKAKGWLRDYKAMGERSAQAFQIINNALQRGDVHAAKVTLKVLGATTLSEFRQLQANRTEALDLAIKCIQGKSDNTTSSLEKIRLLVPEAFEAVVAEGRA